MGFANENIRTNKGGLWNVFLGILFGGLAIFLFLSFFSYLFIGNEDCSINSKTIFDLLKSHSNINNYCGVLGAKASYYLMFRGIGAAAFVFVLFLMFLYCKVLNFNFVKEYGFLKVIVLCILMILSISLLLWYFFTVWHYKQLTNYVGEMTMSLGEMCSTLFGKGTSIFIFSFALTTLSVFFEKNLFNVIIFFLCKVIQKVLISIFLLLKGIKNCFVYITNKIKHRKGVKRSAFTNEKINNDNVEKTNNDNVSDNYIIEKQCKKLFLDSEVDISTYKKPDNDLLDQAVSKTFSIPEEEIQDNVNKIISTYSNFKINIDYVETTVGPVFSLYEFKVDSSVKVAKILEVEDNLSLSLSSAVRIIAPVPNKSTIGIEVPNKRRQILHLRTIFDTDEFKDCKYVLPVVLGKDLFNKNIIVDLTEMPHIIVAGATGQGKSVGLNVMIMSLLYKKLPNEIKFVLIDPKRVEFSLFENISKYFIAKVDSSDSGVVTDLQRSVDVFEALCAEMNNRYNIFKEHFVKNIEEFNSLPKIKKMQYIVVVIDEFADLMINIGKKVEEMIIRLSQLSRAVGIHIIIATQRPTVKFITGAIKANFPARISYKVSSSVDSMTIIDSGGAENLVGNGDSFVQIKSGTIRVQSPYVSTDEIKRVCNFIKTQ